MKTLSALVITAMAALFPLTAQAGFDESVNRAVEPISRAVSGFIFASVTVGDVSIPLIVVWLVAGGLYFTVYLRFLPFRAMKVALDVVRGKHDKPDDHGEVSHFQALTAALSGTVGIGNIGGVAVAVTAGGPGAIFWMILAGVLGMSSKLAECTLAVKYRRYNDDGTTSGGPMYFLEQGLKEKNLGGLGRSLGVFYAVAILFGCVGGGNMFQSNQAYQQFVLVSGGDASWFADKAWLFGLLLAICVGAVIIGGIQGIARVTEKLVPFMAILYVVTGVVILVMNAGKVMGAIELIVVGAFAPKAVAGGAIGALIQGFRRAAFSNEAGLGSAAIAHSAVRTDKPATEGLVAMLEPLIDTVIICTITGLVIVTTVYTPEMASEGIEGVALTSKAFGSAFSAAEPILAVAVMLFAFSTAISWSYYGLKGFTYLFGENRYGRMGFQLVFCGFTMLGCMVNLNAVIDLSDAMIFILAIPNLAGLYLMAGVVRKEIEDYLVEVREPAGS
jgi:AGCS family alanine or glycine:cation symporter